MTRSRAFLETYRPTCLDEVEGNDVAKRMIGNWLMRLGIPRCVLFCGDSGSGKTTLARILAAAAICTNRETGQTRACGQPDCVCSRVLGGYILFGRGMVTRNGVEMSVEQLSFDFAELLHQEVERPVIFFFDEIHRAPAKVRDMLLTKVEEYKDGYNFVLMAATWDEGKLEKAFINRFVRVATQVPSEPDMVAMLRRVCAEESFSFDDATLAEIARDEYYVPRNCLVALWDRVSKL